MTLLTLQEIEQAREIIAPVIRDTRATYANSLSRRLTTDLWLKPEYLQRTGSFKFRGAYSRCSQLTPGSHVVAGSAGNHAQGVALAASMLGHRATIFMPLGASLPKVQATRAYGAEVILGGRTVDECIELAKERTIGGAATLVPPFDHPAILAGQGTIGLELCEQVPDLRTVLVAIGGGGLCAGIAAAIKQVRPEVRVIGVMAAGAASMRASAEAGSPVAVDPATIADGIALRSPTPLTLEHIQKFVDELVVVTDEEITQAMLLLLERAKAVVEPAGAAPLAALCSGAVSLSGGAAAVVLGGGNVDPLLLGKLVDHGLGAMGRYLRVRIVAPDRPGSLAAITEALAELQLNVIEVEHQRFGVKLALNTVAIGVVIETTDHEHQEQVLATLRARGFDVESER
jgi:threonine dehydratase